VFDADRPILHSTQDRLNRAVFAKYLARCMLDHQDPDSLVVGLYGTWGVGKTSLINLVLEELTTAAGNSLEAEKPIILNFSPWSYSGQNQLIYSFFRRLSSALRSVDYLENSTRIIYLLELYVSFFTQKPIPSSLRLPRSLWKRLTHQGHEDSYAWEAGRDLTQVKAELNEILRNQKHKIIIMIDNISRLHDLEVKQIFQIVKSIGDYANTAYLLAFDKEQVVNAINNVDGHGGEAFVEKLVQLPFDVPPILPQDLEKIFADRLQDVMNTVPEDRWNVEYWSDIYYGSLKYFFHNCRDITRYANILSFSYPRLRDVVNPVDFFALTAIEVFAPNLYFAIRENKDLFTDLLDTVYAPTSEQLARYKLRCKEIISRESHLSHELLLDLLMQLFPRIRRIYQPDASFFHPEKTARKWRRLCSPDMFDLYFRLSMQAGEIPASEFNTILASAADATRFDHILIRLNQDGRIIQFLDRLDSNVIDTIPLEHIQAIVSGLLDNADLFPQGTPNALSLDTSMRISRIIQHLLRRLKTTDERFMILQTAIAHANKSLYIIVHELQQQDKEHIEESDAFLPREFRHLNTEQLESLHQLAVSRIALWAGNGSLVDHPKLLPILLAWKMWSRNDDCQRFIQQMVIADRGLLALLMAALATPIEHAMQSYEMNSDWEKSLNNITIFIPVIDLEAHAKLLFEDAYFEKLREKEQLSLMIFLDLIKAETQKVVPSTVR